MAKDRDSRGEEDGLLTEEPGPLAALGGSMLDLALIFYEFFRHNGFLLLLLAVGGMGILLRYSPQLMGRKTLLLAGFAVLAAMLAAIVIGNLRTLRERRRDYLEARERHEHWQDENGEG